MRPVENYMFETLSHFVDSKSWGVLPLGQRHEAAQLRAPSINVTKLVYSLSVSLTNPQTSALVFCLFVFRDGPLTSVGAHIVPYKVCLRPNVGNHATLRGSPLGSTV